MKEEKEKKWAWLMPNGKIYRVVTNPEDGTIKVYNPDGKLVNKEEKLSKEVISLIEKSFLEAVAEKVGVEEKEKGTGTETILRLRCIYDKIRSNCSIFG